MKLADFDFELPVDLIARYPLPSRSASRLMCVNGSSGEVVHRQFLDVVSLLKPGDLLVFNDTKVIPARLIGQKSTGGQVEILIERILSEDRILAQVRSSKPPRLGDFLLFPQYVRLEVLDKKNQFYELRLNECSRSLLEVIESIGQVPLPPYMHRPPEASDKERYQTVFAKHHGSVAAPTAGLHFDKEIIAALSDKGVMIDYITLHIGAGTFTPVRVDNITEHKMHAEYLEVPASLCDKINQARREGRRVVAVGTTTLRALETAAQSGEIEPYRGETSIFIYPGYSFRCVDALITNLHLPRSTLLMLVCAFGGKNNVMGAYRAAVRHHYRFFSYGDAMWITRAMI